jgi:TPR repeat protein
MEILTTSRKVLVECLTKMQMRGSNLILIANLVGALSFLPTAAIATEDRGCDKKCLEKKALLGDGAAAVQLADALLYTDRDKMKWWYMIAAENGSIDGQYSYAHFLALDGKSMRDCLRAIYWFDLAAKKGHALSIKRRNSLRAGLKAGDDYRKGCSRRYMEGT